MEKAINKFVAIWDKVSPVIKYILLIANIFNIYFYRNECFLDYRVMIALNILLIISTYIMLNFLKLKKYDFAYFIITICIVTVMWIFQESSLIQIYYFILLDGAFENIGDIKSITKLCVLHFTGFISAYVIHRILYKSILHGMPEYTFYAVLTYAVILLMYILIHNTKYEREKLKILNYNLIEYSFKEREFLVSEERKRISQELHDSLGHLLMALSMNIRYMKAVKDQEEVQKEIVEIESLVEESISTLRSTVYSLKKLDENCNLYEEIQKIINKFNDLGIIDIFFDFDKRVESAPNNIKNSILVTIKEAITNSLKHGNASEINISIESSAHDIKFKVKDNGHGAEAIKKSNGLIGIEDRLKYYHGTVEFITSINHGFTIEAVIPGGILDDQSNDCR